MKNKNYIKLLEEKISEDSTCFFQRKNNLGETYCAAVRSEYFDEVKKRCRHLGSERSIGCTKEFGELDFMPVTEQTQIAHQEITERLRKIKFAPVKKAVERVYGDSELNLRMSMEYPCNAGGRTK